MSWYNEIAHNNALIAQAQAPRKVLAMFWDNRARDFYYQEILVTGDAGYQGSIERNRIVGVLVNNRTGRVTLRTKGYKYISFDARLPKNKDLLSMIKEVSQKWEVVDALSIAGNLLLEMPLAAICA